MRRVISVRLPSVYLRPPPPPPCLISLHFVVTSDLYSHKRAAAAVERVKLRWWLDANNRYRSVFCSGEGWTGLCVANLSAGQ